MLLRKQTLALFVLLSFVLTSCEFKCSVGGKSPGESDDKKEAKMENGTALYNGITLTSKGNVHVKRAYLTDEKNERIPEGNTVGPKSKTYLVVVLDSGWTNIDGRAYVGASQKVVTDAGTVIMDNPDLFSDPEGKGADAEKAKTINLSVEFIKESMPPTDMTVSFRLWDKKGAGEVVGEYKLHTK